MGAAGAFLEACAPTTDPLLGQGVLPHGDAVGDDGSVTPRFASVEEALTSVVGGTTDGGECTAR